MNNMVAMFIEGKGVLNALVKNYCLKSPQLKTCFYTMLDGLTPCLGLSVQEDITFVKNGVNQLIDFVCYKDGHRIAMFIAEGGPECFQSKVDDLRKCGSALQQSFSGVEAAKALTLAEKCTQFDELGACFMAKLKTCLTPTSGNMAEDLFRQVRKGLPCSIA